MPAVVVVHSGAGAAAAAAAGAAAAATPPVPPTLHRTWSTHGYSPPGTGPRGVSSVGGQSVHT